MKVDLLRDQGRVHMDKKQLVTVTMLSLDSVWVACPLELNHCWHHCFVDAEGMTVLPVSKALQKWLRRVCELG